MADVLISRDNNIIRIQLNRPYKKNALTPDMYNALREEIEKADMDTSVHVIYITGSEDSFTSGNDLNTFMLDPTSDAAARFIMSIAQAQTPIVAAVNGLAVGVGVTMLLHCDLVYAVDSAVFNFAFIDLGVVPEAASSYLLPQMIGQRRAAELLMLGDRFTAEAACEYGIVNQVVSADELESIAWSKAQQLASKPPQALRQTKMLLKRGNAKAVEETIAFELEIFAERMQSDEVRDIMQAFLERSMNKKKG
jgi:enoyl-CoA hydratase/carnithine racemase